MKGINVLKSSNFCHILKNSSFEEVSSFDKNLHSVYEELEKGDINVKQQARVLCSNLSMNVFTSSLLIKGKRLFEGLIDDN